jgi:glycosyltransferase involved in cell wall biosynthesis
MGSRKKIALTYYYSENWIAGSYYVANMLKGVNLLPDAEKPHFIMLIDNNDGLDILSEVKYPYISFLNLNEDRGGLSNWKRKILRRLTGKDHYIRNKLKEVGHVFEGGDHLSFIPKHYYWVHDFQECRLPDFFTPEEAAKRSALPKKVSRLKDATLILSSYDALNDFNTFFPGYLCRVSVLRFASALPDISTVDIDAERERFGINTPFFICSNQFWQHKNHKVILDAIALLKNKDYSFQVVFTGKNFDHRNPDYFASLERFVKEQDLEKWVNFLGFIDRKVQLRLAEQAIAYVQPSLFEGWSTTVEDAKCLNQHILLSDIPVHKEQLDYNVTFFNPHSAQDLASKMEKLLTEGIRKEQRDYSQNVRNFGKDIVTMFS